MSKKKLLSLALVVIMIAVLSYGTLAWFNDSESVTNEFHVSTSDDVYDPEGIFSIDLYEKVDTDGDGVADTVSEGVDGGGAKFEHILPGSNLQKEPIVKNTGKYNQYVRVVVTLSKANAWVEALGYGYDLGTIFEGHDEDLWVRDNGSHDSANDRLVYVYYLTKELAPGEDETLFTNVKLPTALTQEDMAKLGGSFELAIRADAIQTENLGEGVDTAKEAFAAANWGNASNNKPQ